MELRLFLEILIRRRRLLFWVFLAVFGAGLLLVFIAPTQYVASSRVYLFKSPTSSAILSRMGLDVSSPMPAAGLTDVERESYLALSETKPVLDSVISKLHLTRERLSVQLVQLVPLVRPLMNLLGVHIAPRALTFEEFTHKSIVALLFPRPNIKAELYEDSDLLEYQSSADSIEKAVAIANAAARSYAEQETRMRREECARLLRAIEAELPKARQQYEEALKALERFREKSLTVDITTESEKILDALYALYADRDANAADMARTRAMLAATEARLLEIPEYRKSSEVSQRNDFAESVKSTLRDLSLDLANTKTRYTPDHPAVQDIENKIAEAKKILKSQAQKIFGSENVALNPVHQTYEEKLVGNMVDLAGFESLNDAYAALIAAKEEALRRFAPKQTESTMLNALVESRQTIYQALVGLRGQAAAGQSVNFSIVRFVEPAKIPQKITDYMRPKLSLFLAASLFLGLFLGVAAVLVAEYVDETVRSRRDAARPSFPCLGMLPRAEDGDGAARQAFRFLRAGLSREAGGAPLATFLVTSVASSQGRTYAARNLAASLAASTGADGRILVVDADFESPAFDASPGEPGLGEVLSGGAALSQAVAPLDDPGLFLIKAGTAPDFDFAESDAMGRFLAEALTRFQAMVIRCAPAGTSCDAGLLARRADAVLLLAEYGKTTLRDFGRAADGLAGHGARAAGSVINRAPLAQPSLRDLLSRPRNLIRKRLAKTA